MGNPSKNARKRAAQRATEFAELFQLDLNAFDARWLQYLNSCIGNLRRFETDSSENVETNLRRIETALCLCPGPLRVTLVQEARDAFVSVKNNHLIQTWYRKARLLELARIREKAKTIKRDPEGEAKVRYLLGASPDELGRERLSVCQSVDIVYTLQSENARRSKG